MKYHYFHGRFTYSVKRSGPAAGGGRSRFSLRAIAVLDSCVEACAVSVGSAGAGRCWSCAALGSCAAGAVLATVVFLREFIR